MHEHVALQCPAKINSLASAAVITKRTRARTGVCGWGGGWGVGLYVWVGAHRALEHVALAFNLDDTNIIEDAE